MLTIGILKEPAQDHRVSLTPDAAAALVKEGHQLIAEPGSGERSFYTDDEYGKAGVSMKTRKDILESADLLLSINLPVADSDHVREGSSWVGIYQPLSQPEQIRDWAKKKLTLFSLDMLPRTTRAQSMDVLSSQANIAGYKAVIYAAGIYPRYFPMLMTAAGSIAPARVMVLGAGVAGLQAIATARRLGCVVEVFDTRPAVKEEVMSLGARFIEVEGAAHAGNAGGYAVEQSEAFLQKQKEKIAEHAAKADVIITTAQIPGKKAPVLITKAMIATMKAGSVIIDLAAATGGNTECTRNNETVRENGVTIVGHSALYNMAAADASKVYSKNIQNFLKLLLDKEGGLLPDFNDELIKGSCISYQGEIVNERIKGLL